MRIAFYSTKEVRSIEICNYKKFFIDCIESRPQYDSHTFDKGDPHQITYIPHRLDGQTVALAAGHDAVCIFVNDLCDAKILQELHGSGIRYIALRVRNLVASENWPRN